MIEMGTALDALERKYNLTLPEGFKAEVLGLAARRHIELMSLQSEVFAKPGVWRDTANQSEAIALDMLATKARLDRAPKETWFDKLLLKKLVFIFCLLLSFCAHAKPIDVQVIHVQGFGGVSVSEARTVAEAVRNYYSGYGITLNIRGFRSIKNPTPNKFKLSSYQFGILEDFRRWRRSHPYNRRMVLFITPPSGGYLLGAAQTACSIYGTAYAAAEIKNMEGKDRVVHSFTALAHEVGHLLGAEHDDSPTVMNANALPLVRNEILPLSKVSLKQINGCLGR